MSHSLPRSLSQAEVYQIGLALAEGIQGACWSQLLSRHDLASSVACLLSCSLKFAQCSGALA